MSDQPPKEQPAFAPPSFGRSMAALWLYTVLRIGLFLAIWAILYVIGLEWFLAAVIALALSIPLSLVLLAKPRAMLSKTIEERLAARNNKRAEFDARLNEDE